MTNLIADASCPQDYNAVFLDGTAPTQTCDQSAGDQRNVFQKLLAWQGAHGGSRNPGEWDAGVARAADGLAGGSCSEPTGTGPASS